MLKVLKVTTKDTKSEKTYQFIILKIYVHLVSSPCSNVFFVNFEHIWNDNLVFLFQRLTH